MRSLFNKKMIASFFNHIKDNPRYTGRRKQIALATVGAICLNWAVTCLTRDKPDRYQEGYGSTLPNMNGIDLVS